MPAVRKLPDATTLRRLREMNWRLEDIAKEYGVTEGAVWLALDRAGFVESVPTYADLLPWDIAEEHRMTAIMARFRSINRQKRGLPLSEGDERRLTEWLANLEEHDVVVNYHPAAPPNDASTKGGFYYVPREPRDKWIVREPDRMTDE